MRLSVVIPCYNEAESLPELIARCLAVCSKNAKCEIILVDNGSVDTSAEVLARALAGQSAVRSVRVPVNQGYGHGILEGLKACTGEILGWTHADLQTDPGDILQGFALFLASSDPENLFVKGKRFGRPLVDTAFTGAMSVFESILLGHILRDINAQPTLLPRNFFENWQEAPKDFALDLFAYVSAKQAGLKVKRFPVLFAPRRHGMSHWNVDWKAKVKFIRRTLAFSFRLQRTARAR